MKRRNNEAKLETFCSVCGKKLKPNSHDCPKCGKVPVNNVLHLEDYVTIEDHIKTHSKKGPKIKSGKKKRYKREEISGEDFYKKDKKWNYIKRKIDRENNIYKELIKDPKTGEIIKDIKEPLPEHTGHGYNQIPKSKK